MNSFLTLIGKLTLWFSKILNLGAGSTWPGHIAMETNPKFVQNVLKKNPNLKIVLIAGTNGKTTTSLMLQKILEEEGLKVFRNEAGANLLNGLASTIIQKGSLTGRLNFDAMIFEVDENNLSLVLAELSHVNGHMSIVLLNLFRDQLDRYGEVNTIAQKWNKALRKLPISSTIFTNGDDPKLADIANDSTLVRYYFGIDESLMKKSEVGYDVDFAYCPNCNTKLKFSKVAYSHLGKFHCPNCGYTNPDTMTFPSLPHPLLGTYNIYNENAAVLVANKVFNVSKDTVHKALVDFKPAFGRQEKIVYKDRDVVLLLAKNPAGANQAISAINEYRHPELVSGSRNDKKPNILLVLNDRIPDGRDVSWIWDVDFDELKSDVNKIFVSGDRVFDMSLRIKYSQLSHVKCQMFENLQEAIDTSISETAKDETLFILPTYSAMLEVRKILTGRSIL
ncbi:MAG TPA: MurT ligase domain-containing protein [Patescibacteria group bacterium]|nr:MurT ligase domain-containing protein [Patescibacteria group bacterium]